MVFYFKDCNFLGYHRSDGRVGTANYWLFIPTVFCENRNLDIVKEAMLEELGYSINAPYKVFMKNLVESFEKKDSLENISLQPLETST